MREVTEEKKLRFFMAEYYCKGKRQANNGKLYRMGYSWRNFSFGGIQTEDY